jgi:hypothetical protein
VAWNLHHARRTPQPLGQHGGGELGDRDRLVVHPEAALPQVFDGAAAGLAGGAGDQEQPVVGQEMGGSPVEVEREEQLVLGRGLARGQQLLGGRADRHPQRRLRLADGVGDGVGHVLGGDGLAAQPAELVEQRAVRVVLGPVDRARRSRIPGSTAWVTRSAPSAFSWNSRSTASSGTVSSGARTVSPALLTSTSTWPAAAMAASTLSWSVTSSRSRSATGRSASVSGRRAVAIIR